METQGLRCGANICALGDQTVRLHSAKDLEVIERFLSKFGANFDAQRYSRHIECAMHVRAVYEDCGMTYVSIDMNESDNSYPVDLNEPPKTHSIGNTFDMLTNYGTSEHVCNQISAYAWSHYLLKNGGLMFLALPIFHFANHAMSLATPYFFKKLIDGNRYEILESRIIASPTDQGLAFHYGRDLGFIAGLPHLIETSPVATPVWMVL